MSLRDRLAAMFHKNSGDIEITTLREEFLEIFLESDISMDVTEEILNRFQASFQLQKRISRDQAIESLKAIMTNILERAVPPINILQVKKIPYVIMFLGINGTGKTTTIARLAYYLKQNGKTSVISASDTFRAGAIDQIRYHGEKLGVRVISQTQGSDPSAVAFDTIAHAKARNTDYVLIDTAGRMQTNRNLMDEMKKIKRVSNPDLSLLTVDAMAASDALEQASTFLRDIKFDGVVVTKLDTEARGGSIFSLALSIGKPIYFMGIGQEHGDLIEYSPSYVINRIFPK